MSKRKATSLAQILALTNDLTPNERDTLLDYLRATLPKAERKPYSKKKKPQSTADWAENTVTKTSPKNTKPEKGDAPDAPAEG